MIVSLAVCNMLSNGNGIVVEPSAFGMATKRTEIGIPQYYHFWKMKKLLLGLHCKK